MNVNGPVDIERGIISREMFVNEEIDRREQEQVFAHAWLFIGHASQIPNPTPAAGGVFTRAGELNTGGRR